MLRSESVIMIREKALEGKSAYQIGKELGISKNTVKKYLDLGVSEKPQYPGRGSKLDPYKPELDRLMEEGIFNCVVLLERIQEQGYTGKITIVRDYVQSRMPPKTVPAVRRYETKAEKQCNGCSTSGQVNFPVFYFRYEWRVLPACKSKKKNEVAHFFASASGSLFD